LRTYTPKPADITRAWHIVDADGLVLGRLATEVAAVLRGKHKPTFAPHVDTGDHVIVINADKAVLTGKKGVQKFYRRTTTQPGSMKEVRAEVMKATFPERIIESAVKGMLPKGPLGRAMYRKLKVYAGPEHEQSAQQPQILTIQK